MKRLFHIVALALCMLPAIADAANQYVRHGAPAATTAATGRTPARRCRPHSCAATLLPGRRRYGSPRSTPPTRHARRSRSRRPPPPITAPTAAGPASYGDGQAVFGSCFSTPTTTSFDGQRRNMPTGGSARFRNTASSFKAPAARRCGSITARAWAGQPDLPLLRRGRALAATRPTATTWFTASRATPTSRSSIAHCATVGGADLPVAWHLDAISSASIATWRATPARRPCTASCCR